MKTMPITPAVAATGTLTVVDYTALAGAVVTVNSFPLTEGIDWAAMTSNAATATDLAFAITAASASNTLCTAEAVGGLITLTAITPGAAGNSLALTTSDAVNLPRSGATLANGADAFVTSGIAFTGPGRVKSLVVSSSGVGNLGVKIINGQASNATEYDYVTGTTDRTTIRTYRRGLCLPAGCYLVPEANVLTVDIEYELI